MRKKNRLTGAEIRGLRSPRRLHGGLFSVTIAPLHDGVPKFACVVSKKVASKAVERNLIKRRSRAALQKHLTGTAPGSYVFYAKKDAAGASFASVEKDIKNLLSQLRGA